MDRADTKPRYWKDYGPLQQTKHQILKRYLQAWYPILASHHGRVVYIDTHAGRGRHDTGHPGSPLIALQTLLDHHRRDAILARCEVVFLFCEKDRESYASLCDELARIELPSRVRVLIFDDDYETRLSAAIDDLEKRGRKLAPSFVFVDPFTFRLSNKFLRRLLRFEAVELFINFMYRYVNMAMRNPAQTANMDVLFGTPEWARLPLIHNAEERYQATLELFAKQLPARWVTWMTMRGEKGEIKYTLVHATNHPKGREVMKDTMWSLCPDGRFEATARDHPGQTVLFEREPDLRELRERLFDHFRGQEVPLDPDLYRWLDDQLWRKTHLHKVLQEYFREDPQAFPNSKGRRLVLKNNPLVRFPS